MKGARLLFSLGEFRGVEVPDKLTDEPLDELPYFDLFYRYISESGYNLFIVSSYLAKGLTDKKLVRGHRNQVREYLLPLGGFSFAFDFDFPTSPRLQAWMP